MADIFISYSRTDRDRCTAIRGALEALKVDVWSDAGISAGSSFDREIEREIDAAKALLVLWSAESVESDWVRNEARTGKERDRLIAVQLDECQLPLEFRSVQAQLMPEQAEGTDDAVWLGILERIGALLDRPGLAEFERLKADAGVDEWKAWLSRYGSDPLAADVVDNIISQAGPEMNQQLAAEKAKRAALEAELAEHLSEAKAQSSTVATNARELARLKRELDEAQSGQQDAEAELARFREATGAKKGADDGGLSALGIVLDERIAIYLAGLLWIVAFRFIWEPLDELINGRGALPDVFWIVFGIVTLVVPAFIVTIKVIRKRRAAAASASEAEAVTDVAD